MTKGNYPPISPGAIVKTTLPNMKLRDEWTDEGWVKRKWGVLGRVTDHHDSHGLCYDVRHEDGTQGCYDPSELEVLPTKRANLLARIGIAIHNCTRVKISQDKTISLKLRGTDIDADLLALKKALDLYFIAKETR